MSIPIVVGYPPLWDELNAAFNIGKLEVVFAWGDRIYNPQNTRLHPSILCHESVHCERQGGGDAEKLAVWWKRYIEDPLFRLEEEIPAHRAEYHACVNGDRNQRSRALQFVAGKLASPLYGGLITQREAMQAILNKHYRIRETA